MEYYLAIKKNDIISFAGKWMELELTMLSKISPKLKMPNIACSHSFVEWSPDLK
jgi:hypothetical protein